MLGAGVSEFQKRRWEEVYRQAAICIHESKSELSEPSPHIISTRWNSTRFGRGPAGEDGEESFVVETPAGTHEDLLFDFW